jgi:hypothetical protein
MKLIKSLSIISIKFVQLHIVLCGSWLGTVIYSKAIYYTKNYVVSINGILCSGIIGGTFGVYACNLFI